MTGAVACVAPSFQRDWFQTHHVVQDADFRSVAAIPPVWANVHYIGQQSDGGYVYEIWAGRKLFYLVIWQDEAGLVFDDNVADCGVGNCGRPT